jgi:DNA polymerase III subunit alpha
VTSFTHLNVHSEYSIMESAVKIEDLIRAASTLNMKAVALTDKYMMGGAVRFYEIALSASIKPIIGCEICLSDADGLSRMILLVKTIRGYENLCRIVSRSNLEKKYSVPSIDISYLSKNSSGLIGLSGCPNGKIPRLLKNRDIYGALKTAFHFIEIFEGDFYIEIQRVPLQKTGSYNNLSELVSNFVLSNNLSPVATNNVRYIDKNSYCIYRHLYKLKSMGIKKELFSELVNSGENYFKSTEEMISMFRDIPEAISNTHIIADKCNLDLGLGKTWLPTFKVPEGESLPGYLKKLCMKGFLRKFGQYPDTRYLYRLEKELKIIEKTGFIGYFLIIADMAEFARKRNILICGKGSAAGSLVSYLLGISDVDPVDQNLYFERFLNTGRKSPPDIDIDVCSSRRSELLSYLSSRYGAENVSRVCLFSTMRPRAAIREAGRIMGLGKSGADDLLERPDSPERFSHRRKTIPGSIKESAVLLREDGTSSDMQSCALKIENYIRHMSMHPSAFIISCRDLPGTVPLTLSDAGEVMTQYDMESIGKLGLIKTDLISSISLSLINDVTRTLREQRNIHINISEINHEDKKVFDAIKSGNTLGVFQLESSGIRSLAKKLKPSDLDDITILISLYRPGPQQSGMVKNFIERKFGREDTVFIHKDLEPILGDTYGVILYQEQVMRIAIEIAGYSFSEADMLRKAIAGLSSIEMEKQRLKFIRGSLNKGYSPDFAIHIFDLISRFANYGFVRAHAAAYSKISYKIAYLKVNFPAELISSILSNNSGYYRQAQYIEEARRLGLILKLPDINKSKYRFCTEDNGKAIRVPLTSIRDLGPSGAKFIIKERTENGYFKNFFDFYKRCIKKFPLNKNAVENLIRIGGFDYTGANRKNLLKVFHYLRILKHYPFDLTHPALNSVLKLECNKNSYIDIEEKIEEESRILGFCISYNPLEYFRNELKKFNLCSSGTFFRILKKTGNNKPGDTDITCAGIILSRRVETTKDRKKILFCTMEDRDGIFDLVFFTPVYRKYFKTLTESTAMIVKGNLHQVDGDITVIGKEVIDLALLKKINKNRRAEALRYSIISGSEPVWKN